MRSSKLLLILSALCVSALLASTPISADVINVTTGTQVFVDTFEGLGNNVSHTDYAHNDGGDYDPIGGGWGGWTIVEQGADRIQVTDATGSNEPGASQGKNYLRLVRDGAASPTAFENFQAMQAKPDDHIRWSQMVYLSSAAGLADNPVAIAGLGTGDVVRFNIITNNSPGAHSVGTYFGTWPPTAIALSYAVDEWQKWQIDYTIGATTFDLTIGQSKVSGIQMTSAGDLGVIRISSDSSGVPVYIDEVPEPSGVALLLSAMVGLLAYAWRKRR